MASFPSLFNLQIMLFLLFNVLLFQKKLSFNGNHPQIIHTFKARTYLPRLFCISLSNGYFRAILSFPHRFSELVLHKCLLQEGETSLLGFDVFYLKLEVCRILPPSYAKGIDFGQFYLFFLLICTDSDFGGYKERLEFTLSVTTLLAQELIQILYTKCKNVTVTQNLQERLISR